MALSEGALSVVNSIPFLLRGVSVTLQITFLALLIGSFFGLVLAVMRVYGGGISRRLATAYSRVIRSLPLLVILFMLYYATYGVITMTEFFAVVMGLAVHTSAYQLEIFRGAIQSIGSGQMEAAQALGMNKIQCIIYVILPQALRKAVPYWGNEAAIVLKDSSFAFVLGIADLMRRGQYVSARTSQLLLTYVTVGLMYLILTTLLTRMLSLAESRVKIPE